MLVLQRWPGESVNIGPDLIVTVREAHRQRGRAILRLVHRGAWLADRIALLWDRPVLVELPEGSVRIHYVINGRRQPALGIDAPRSLAVHRSEVALRPERRCP